MSESATFHGVKDVLMRRVGLGGFALHSIAAPQLPVAGAPLGVFIIFRHCRGLSESRIHSGCDCPVVGRLLDGS
jgi:hypothetical protein